MYVLMLTQHLEEGSATVAALRGGRQFEGWTLSTHLLRDIANSGRIANYQRAGKGARKPDLIPMPKKDAPRHVARVRDVKKALEEKEKPVENVS